MDLSLRNLKGLVNGVAFLPYFRLFRGLMETVVGYNSYFSFPARNWIESCKAAGLPYNPDINTHKGALGVTKMSA